MMTMKAHELSPADSPLSAFSELKKNKLKVFISSSEDFILSGQELFESYTQPLFSPHSPSALKWLNTQHSLVYKNQNFASVVLPPSSLLNKQWVEALQSLSYLSGLTTKIYRFRQAIKNINEPPPLILVEKKEFSYLQKHEQTALRAGGALGSFTCLEDVHWFSGVEDLLDKNTVLLFRNPDVLKKFLSKTDLEQGFIALHTSLNFKEFISQIPPGVKLGLWEEDIKPQSIESIHSSDMQFILSKSLSYPKPIDFFLKYF